MTGPAVETASDKADAEARASKFPTAFVASFNSKDNEQFKTWSSVAEANRQLGKFIMYVDGQANNVAVSFHQGQQSAASHSIGSKDDLVKFCKEEFLPYFAPIGSENYDLYNESGRGLVWLASKQKEYDNNRNIFIELAKTFRSQYNFGWLDTERFKKEAPDIVGVEEYPAIVVQAKDGRYLYPHSEFDMEQITAFLRDVGSGKVEKFFRSDDVPPPNDDPVQVVVGKTFKEIVFQKDKHVILQVYAPW